MCSSAAARRHSSSADSAQCVSSPASCVTLFFKSDFSSDLQFYLTSDGYRSLEEICHLVCSSASDPMMRVASSSCDGKSSIATIIVDR